MTRPVTGLETVMRNLQAEIAGIENRTREGLLEAALKIEAASNARVPRDTGNLAASSYARVSEDGRLAVEIGYTSNYALYVHENLEMKLKGQPRSSGRGVYWGPKGENKFLEKTLAMNHQAILEIVRRHASVGHGEQPSRLQKAWKRIKGWFGR